MNLFPLNFTKNETMTTLEQIRVMQAYVDGKKIQVKSGTNGEWIDIDVPYWDWADANYRIKPEKKLAAYANGREFLEAMKKHGPYVTDKDDILKIPTVIGKATVVVGFSNEQPTLEELARDYKWQDGSPCGIMQ